MRLCSWEASTAEKCLWEQGCLCTCVFEGHREGERGRERVHVIELKENLL